MRITATIRIKPGARVYTKTASGSVIVCLVVGVSDHSRNEWYLYSPAHGFQITRHYSEIEEMPGIAPDIYKLGSDRRLHLIGEHPAPGEVPAELLDAILKFGGEYTEINVAGEVFALCHPEEEQFF